jgi:hypothetical protein
MSDGSARIPTSEVPILVLKCYHLSAFASAQRTQLEFVDPARDVSHLLQEWSGATWRDDGASSIRHLEVHDRRGVRRFLCQRSGQVATYHSDCIRFECLTDYDSVLPNPGVLESVEQFERDACAG